MTDDKTQPRTAREIVSNLEGKLREAEQALAAARTKEHAAQADLQAALVGSDASAAAQAYRTHESATQATERASRKVEALEAAMTGAKRDAVPLLAQEAAVCLDKLNAEAVRLAHGFGLAIEQAYAAAEKLEALSQEHSNAARAFTTAAAEWGVEDAHVENGKFPVVLGEVRRVCKLTIPARFRVSRASVLAPGFEFPPNLKGGDQ